MKKSKYFPILSIVVLSGLILISPVNVQAVDVLPQMSDFAGAILNKQNISNGFPREKAQKIIPSRFIAPEQFKTTIKNTINTVSPPLQVSGQPIPVNPLVTDVTPPTSPTTITATANSIFSINANWDDSVDPESGISYYAFAIGTSSSGDITSLANVRWWQVANGTSTSVNLNLDPNVTYYVSVVAVNGAGLWSNPLVSSPIHPVWTNIGDATNVMQLGFGSVGYDLNGNVTSGWTADQMAKMTSFFNKMYPILVDLYGPPSVSYTVKAVRDLRYSGSNIFIPSTGEIRMDDGFYPQLFTHELLHAFRNHYLLSSDSNWNFDPTLSGFEESFAQGVSYDAMNRYVAMYPADTLVPGNSLWDSSYDSDYDYQNMPELRGTDFWSDGGGTGLFWLRYEVGAKAIEKINIESPGFYKNFNKEYYNRINANPTSVRPTHALIVDIIKTLVPQIEGIPTEDWINKQNIFYTQNVYGNKIFHKVQDYPWVDFFAFHTMYFMDTMACGSEWACWDGTQWVYHHLNGSSGSGSLTDTDGNIVWSGPLLIQPITNPPSGFGGFGSDMKNLTTASGLLPWPGGNVNDYIMNLNTLGLYKFESTFNDPVSGATTTNSIYRVIGRAVAGDFKGVWGGVIGHKNGIIYLNHDGFADEPGLTVSKGVFAGSRSWTGIPNTRTGGTDSVPGKVSVTFVDSDTGITYSAKRNIGYGSYDGSQMFLFDFTTGGSSDSVPPVVSINIPIDQSYIFGTTTFTASATDNVKVSLVQFLLDNVNLSGPILSNPYSLLVDTNLITNGSHILIAVAKDSTGNTSTSTPINIIVDNSSPALSWTSPAIGSIVTGIVPLAVAATSGTGISKVEFFMNTSTLIGVSTSNPYIVNWNTQTLVQGNTYSLYAKAYGKNGKTTTSSNVNLTIKDITPPSVSITSPRNGTSVSRNTTINIQANATDNKGVRKVEFYVNNVLKCTDTTSPYTCSWQVPSARRIKYNLTATAYDLSGNTKDAVSTVTSN